jgi:hypothetical protein
LPLVELVYCPAIQWRPIAEYLCPVRSSRLRAGTNVRLRRNSTCGSSESAPGHVKSARPTVVSTSRHPLGTVTSETASVCSS